jgi:ferredoxin
MRIDVDFDTCGSHGQCELAAPAVFTLDDNGFLDFKADVPAGQEDAVRAAVVACPTQSITIVEE